MTNFPGMTMIRWKNAISNRREILESEIRRVLPILVSRGVRRVILFGSLADGRVRSTSDVDLIIVEETEARFLDRLDELYRALAPRVAMDILVYTPREFEDLRRHSSFVRLAASKGKVLYDAELEKRSREVVPPVRA